MRILLFALLAVGCTKPAPPAEPVSTSTAVYYDVVLVGADDVLNVRASPAADAPVIHTFAHDFRGVRATGDESGRWLKLQTPGGIGWANANYLTVSTSTFSFALGSLSDLAPLVGPRGLTVFDYGAERRFTAADLASPTKLQWNGPGCGENCRPGTFAEIITAPLAAILSKPNRQVSRDHILRGGNASSPAPAKLANFRFVSLLDPGTDAHDHLDWRAFTLYFEMSAGAWKLVAIVPDQWSP